MIQRKNITAPILILSLALQLFLFAYTAYNSYGYDDEYFNINNVEGYTSLYELASDHLSGRFVDVHPLGQCLINYILLKAFGSWNLVRVIGALIAALSLWLYWRYLVAEKLSDGWSILFAYVFMCINPTVLLWCTSVRWYTYFLPLVCVIGMLLSSPKALTTRKYLFWAVYFITVSLMFYLESSSAIMIITSFILLLIQHRKALKEEYKAILCFGVLSLAFVSRQIYLFLTVLYPSVKGSGEFYSLAASFVGGGHNFLSSHAVMPLSVPGIMLIAANFLLFIVFIINIKAVSSSWPNKFFILSYAGIILARIAGKIRNFVGLTAPFGGFMADVFSRIRNKILKIAILALYLTGTSWGIYNVVAHTDTTRGTWNTPYAEILEFIADYNREDYIVLSHNPVFDYHAEQLGFNTADSLWDTDCYEKLAAHKGPAIILKTYKGSLTDDDYAKFNAYIDSKKVILSKKFGYDKFAAFKRRIDKNYPDYYAEILVCE